MKKLVFRLLMASSVVVAGLGITSCKDKKKDPEVVNSTTTDSTTTAPVVVSGDDAIQNGLRDATKDYPEVTATVSNGEVTLTGSIERDRLPKLIESVNHLNPKKVNNQLTIK